MGARRYRITLRVFNSISHARVRELSERARYKVEHEKRYSIYTSDHLFCLLYRHTDKDIFTIFRRKISDHFPDDFRKSSKTCPKVTRTLPNIFLKFRKINEDFRFIAFRALVLCLESCFFICFNIQYPLKLIKCNKQ